MPRDINGLYSRTVPPGAVGYQAGTIWDANVVNAEVNDIGNELTNSLTKNGTTLPTANLPMAGFVHSGLGVADADGETLRFQALKKGSNISITSSGIKTIPAEGSYFELTGTGFNITGFNANYDGRIVHLELPAGLTLINGASLILEGGLNRVTFAGDIITLVNKSGSIWKQINYQYAIGKPAFNVNRNGTNLAITVGVVSSLGFTNASYDPYIIYDGISEQAIIPENGLYDVFFQFSLVSVGSITSIEGFIIANGSTVSRSRAATSGLNGINANTHYKGYFNVGDILEFKVQVLPGSGSATIAGTNNLTYASLTKI